VCVATVARDEIAMVSVDSAKVTHQPIGSITTNRARACTPSARV
jgi:hypothetical protein